MACSHKLRCRYPRAIEDVGWAKPSPWPSAENKHPAPSHHHHTPPPPHPSSLTLGFVPLIPSHPLQFLECKQSGLTPIAWWWHWLNTHPFDWWPTITAHQHRVDTAALWSLRWVMARPGEGGGHHSCTSLLVTSVQRLVEKWVLMIMYNDIHIV